MKRPIGLNKQRMSLSTKGKCIRAAVESIVYGAVNEAFLPVEQMFTELDKGDDSKTEPDISDLIYRTVSVT